MKQKEKYLIFGEIIQKWSDFTRLSIHFLVTTARNLIIFKSTNYSVNKRKFICLYKDGNNSGFRGLYEIKGIFMRAVFIIILQGLRKDVLISIGKQKRPFLGLHLKNPIIFCGCKIYTN